MKFTLSVFLFVSSTVAAFAGQVLVPVPEIDAVTGLAALGLVGTIATLIWERRRKQLARLARRKP